MAGIDRFNGTIKTVLVTVTTMLIPVIAFAFGYGKLSQRVESLEADIKIVKIAVNHIDVIRNDIGHIYEKLEDIDEKLE